MILFLQDFDEDYYCDKFHTGDKCQFMQDCKHDGDCKNGEYIYLKNIDRN